MKIKDAKALLETLMFTNEENKLSRTEIMKKYPMIVMKSREKHDSGVQVYRVLKVRKNSQIEQPNDSESTTTSINSAMKIESSMPSFLMSENEIYDLDSHLLSFEVPKDNILIDVSVALPFLKNKLKNHLNQKIKINRYGEKLSIEKVFEEVEHAEENEILADLQGLDCKQINLKNKGGFSFSCNLSQISRGFKDLTYLEDFAEQYMLVKDILTKEDSNFLSEFIKENDIELPNLKSNLKSNLKNNLK